MTQGTQSHHGDLSQVQEEWRAAGVRPGEELLPAEDLAGHTDCMYLPGSSS